jgi:hypothetical protein
MLEQRAGSHVIAPPLSPDAAHEAFYMLWKELGVQFRCSSGVSNLVLKRDGGMEEHAISRFQMHVSTHYCRALAG